MIQDYGILQFGKKISRKNEIKLHIKHKFSITFSRNFYCRENFKNPARLFFSLVSFYLFKKRTRISFFGKSRALWRAGSKFPATRSILNLLIMSEAKVKYSVIANFQRDFPVFLNCKKNLKRNLFHFGATFLFTNTISQA